ncbi:phosphate ABC transporter substrate-binding protein PstS family protein [Bacillus mangrovi]|uniref:Phosphate-binding protein n=1 Tax=Metabacillus mangrovi TaxID=1491830 RepID=A0A7X2S2E3_9BACI|nr:PstS family phosphate ABC transporter substrate-binding protein [Metabacillus mangrovi]MTH52429.1 phosphate ABC transporter substrate-binding protein PstS family protein [Metabacillus mangrovi]
MKSLKFAAVSIMASSFLALAACGGGENSNGNNNSEPKTEEQGEKKLSGEIMIDGSSTVGPIGEVVAEEFNAEHPDVQAPIGVSGTGGGFERFAAGETDISQASRPIKDEEKEALEKAGIEFTEFKVANDGLSVVVNKENDWVKEMTVDQLQQMWSDGGAKMWSDIDPSWPKEEIKFYSPGTDSGTYDYFTEAILEANDKENEMTKAATLSEDDNVLVKGVQNDKNAIGYFGYAYYVNNKDSFKVVPVVNEEGKAVEPSDATVEDGSYNPLSRPLYIYVKNDSMKEKEEVKEFVRFYLENASAMAPEAGYVSLPQDETDAAMKAFEEATK